ncbi:uncharacterized protein LOC130135278 [Syzygium oleosum]|uniref:uncharacterized protein LOC130135278 n=1 Tax=Syzygium oleosum TaxID=219896 RepID=UPI0024BA2F78|nr:uncharacterized protein LOC130135278 [Syzygium oleosum]
MNFKDASLRFGIPTHIERLRTVHPVGNDEVYIWHYTLVWVDVSLAHYETHEYLAWCFQDRFGDEFGPIRSADVPFVGEGQLDPQCPNGDIIDVDMESNQDSEVEYEIVEDEEEHEELGGVAFEPEVVDPIPEQVYAEAPEPMDIAEAEEQEPSESSSDLSAWERRTTISTCTRDVVASWGTGRDISFCESLRKLPDLSSSKGLREVCISSCGSLAEIQGELPQSLEKLKIDDCESLQKLPDLSSLKGLREVWISSCGSLAEIQGELPQSLKKLEISFCESLQKLPDLSSSKGLREVCISSCGSLAEIRGELPQSLEELEVDDCESLRKLPDLSSLKGLREVEINRCKKLDVEAISSLCSEKGVKFLEEDNEWDGEDRQSESKHDGEDNESESEGDDAKSESEDEGEDNESESQGEDEE